MPAVVFTSFGPALERQNKTYLHHSLTPSSCLYIRFFAFLYCVLLDYTFHHSPNHLLKVEDLARADDGLVLDPVPGQVGRSSARTMFTRESPLIFTKEMRPRRRLKRIPIVRADD